MSGIGNRIEILDTTLRDGEQTDCVSFSVQEKVQIADFLLRDLAVDRIEAGSCRVSQGEFEAVQSICRNASEYGMPEKVEVLGFVDGKISVDWLCRAGGKVLNLLCKGSEKHCRGQLGKTLDEHVRDIREVISYARERGVNVNIYLEDWSGGMKESEQYVFDMLGMLSSEPVLRYMLSDTLGVLNPVLTSKYLTCTLNKFPQLHFDFHAHNDYDLAVANSVSAAVAGVKAIHTTVNGLGERAGNTPLASIHAILKDHFAVSSGINENMLYEASKLVECCSGIPVPVNKPVVGEKVFMQVAGIHADGDSKGGLYCSNLLPERFGRRRSYSLGKTSGKANIRRNLEEMGIKLDEKSMALVTRRVIELGDKKELVMPEDLPYIAADVLKNPVENNVVKLIDYSMNLAYGSRPMSSVRVEIDGRQYGASSSGSGQYDAFVKALRKIWKDELSRELPVLENYVVTIPPGGRTDALVQTVITWKWDNRILRTCALDADQNEAAIKATMKMLNVFEQDFRKEQQ